MADPVEEHFRLFNEAVRSRNWTAFLTTFAPDAVMSFDGVPAGPFTLHVTWRDGAVADLTVRFEGP